MGEAKRRREAGDDGRRFYDFGPTLARKMELDEQIAHIESLIEADQVHALCTIAIVETGLPHIFKIEFGAHGASPRQAYEAVSVVMRQFESVYGFAKEDAPAED